MKAGLKTAARVSKAFVTRNSGSILTGLGVLGVFTTMGMAIKATPKALELIEDAEQLKYDTYGNDHLTTKETLGTTWKCYVPTAIMAGVTVSCIVGANAVNLKQKAAIAGLYSISETALKEYQAKVVEMVGESKERKIRDEVAKDTLEKNPVGNKQVIITGKGDVLCFESLSGRYFRSTVDKLKRVEYDVNSAMMREMYMSLNDVYYAMGLDPNDLGRECGWNNEHPLEFYFTTIMAENDEPCISVQYRYLPSEKYNSVY